MSAATELPWSPALSQEESACTIRDLFENAPIFAVQCHADGAVILMNPALELMLDPESRSTRPVSFADLLPPEDQPCGQRLLFDLLHGQRDHFQLEVRSSARIACPIRWTAWRVPATQSSDAYVLALGETQHANAETEQRIRQAQRLEAVGRLAGGVAHDFNNLLTGVLLYCDLLMSALDPDDRARKYAEEIRNAGMQASALVRQLLTVARPANSAPRLLSLNEIAEGMRDLLRKLIGETIELNLQLDPNLGLVKMDPTQVQQILLNLVLNSRDAMPGGGQITVETRNCKVQIVKQPGMESGPTGLPCAMLAVADNGVGMDAATRSRIFEAFFTTKAGKGTGLGLATVHDAVTSNGGLIHVDSAPGKGTRVTVLLPLAPEMVSNTQRIFNSQINAKVAPSQKE